MPTLTIENLFARRSIRKFTADEVSPEHVHILLEAAMSAPSAGNRKPWHFVVVTDAETRRALSEAHTHAQMLLEAPVCIVPCGEPGLGYPGHIEFWIQDLSAATTTMLIAATGLGLGAVWCGVHPVAERVSAVRRILGVPERLVPFAYVAVGHPAEEKEPRTQFDPERVHYQRW